MCSFITQHRYRKFWGSIQLACWLQECPPERFQRIWQYIQPASQPQTTCNHTSPGPPHPASSTPRSSETSHPDSFCNNRFAYPNKFCTNCQKPSQGSFVSSACSSSSSGSQPDWSSSSLPTWVCKVSNSMASDALERCFLHWWILVFVVQGRWQTACLALCGWAVCWCQRCGSSGPWWRWGYGMGTCMLWTMNTGAFYWWHFECTDIQWWDPEAHCFAIHPRPSPHVAAWYCTAPCCKNLCTIPGSWKHPSSCMASILTGHVTIERVLDALDRRIRQRVPVSANIQQLRTAIDEEWTNIQQAMAWPFIVASLRHTCAIIMLSNQHLATPVRWMDYLGKGEVLTNTDLDRFVNNIWEK